MVIYFIRASGWSGIAKIASKGSRKVTSVRNARIRKPIGLAQLAIFATPQATP